VLYFPYFIFDIEWIVLMKQLTFRFALIQSFYWMAFSVLIGYSSTYLLAVGFNSEQTGIMVAVAGLASAVFQPVLASYADRRGGSILSRLTFGLTLLLLLLSGVLFFLYGRSLWATGCLYAAAIGVLQMMTALINALGMGHSSVNFGLCRGMGSIFYAVISSIIGFAISARSAVVIPLTLVIIFLGLLISLMFFPKKIEAEMQPSVSAENSSGFFHRNPQFIRIMVACICVYISHVLINNFVYQIIVSRGGGSSEMGITMSIACVMELPVMFLFGLIRKRVSISTWVNISTIGFTCKSLFTLLSPNVLGLYLAQIFQVAGWGLFAVASVYYVHEMVAPEDQAKGQAYITMTYAIATVFGSFLGGVLIERISVNAMLLVATAVSTLGAIIQFSGGKKH
jgi:PPP family 3-phenylpropionic acid transporter